MTASAPASATIDVAHEARVRRWWYVGEPHLALERSEVLAGPADRTLASIGPGGQVRVAVLAAPDGPLEGAARRGFLASGARTVLWLRSNDGSTFAERAGVLRLARPDLVVVLAGDPRHTDDVIGLCEAFRAGCGDQSPAPRAVVTGDARTTSRLHGALAAFGVEVLTDPRRPDGQAALIGRVREFRRGTDAALVLRDEALEALARSLARVAGAPALIADVAGATTALVHATPEGVLTAVHASGIGVGRGADSVVARGGLDGVRRWIPRAIDAPGLLERVFNRARWPDAVAADPLALSLEIALAHEAIAHTFADAEAAGLPVATLRAAPVIAVPGRAADLPRPAQSLIVAIDAIQPTALCSILRDRADALVAIGGIAARETAVVGVEGAIGAHHEALALVASFEHAAKLRIVSEGVRRDETVERGAFRALPLEGTVELVAQGTSLRGRGVVGPLGLVLDARGRPLALPARDAERIPAVAGWFASIGALGPSADGH